MEEVTGLSQSDLWVLFLLASSFWLMIEAAGRRTPGSRARGGLLVLPTLAAAGLLLITISLKQPIVVELPAKLTDRLLALPAAAVTMLVGLAMVDLFFGRALPLAVMVLAHLKMSLSQRADIAMAVLLAPALALSAGFSLALHAVTEDEENGLQLAHPVQAVAAYDLPGQPMGMALDGPTSGYLTLWHGDRGEGSVARFELPQGTDEDIRLRIVAEGLSHPRGVALLGDELYVAELGEMPCEVSYPQCRARDLMPDSSIEGEQQIIGSTRGRVTAYQVHADRSLGAQRVVLSDLPVVSTEHGVNGMAAGPDDHLYLVIGNVDILWREPERAEPLTPHPEWLGTVLRFDGSGAAPEVFAEGLRNVYQVAFDDRGSLWGIDNDGPTLGGWRGEEILHIRQGHHYGFPQAGTFDTSESRSDPPVWLTGQAGAAGVAWAGDLDLPPGLLIGSCGELAAFHLIEVAGGWSPGGPDGVIVDDVSPVPVISGIPGCVSTITVADDVHAIAGVFTYRETGLLYVISFR